MKALQHFDEMHRRHAMDDKINLNIII